MHMDDPHRDAERLEDLWRQHYAAVLAYGRRRAPAEAAAEIAAEVFTVAWRRLADVPTEPRAWLLGVARRTLANRRRAEGRRERLAARLEEGARTASGDSSDGADDSVPRALARLTPREREALLLIAWDGLGRSEAAAVCGCTEAAFRVRLHRARRRFADALDAPPDQPEQAAQTIRPDEGRAR
jgi:RNA polymerase sigma-70 factor (ECF subfamily)